MLETVRNVALHVCAFAVVDPTVPGVVAMSNVDDLGTVTIVRDAIIHQSGAIHVAIVVVGVDGIGAPEAIINLRNPIEKRYEIPILARDNPFFTWKRP